MKKFLGILILAFLFCGNGFAREMNVFKKKLNYQKKKGLYKCKAAGNTGCYVHYS